MQCSLNRSVTGAGVVAWSAQLQHRAASGSTHQVSLAHLAVRAIAFSTPYDNQHQHPDIARYHEIKVILRIFRCIALYYWYGSCYTDWRSIPWEWRSSTRACPQPIVKHREEKEASPCNKFFARSCHILTQACCYGMSTVSYPKDEMFQSAPDMLQM